jgi:hypothetical protein
MTHTTSERSGNNSGYEKIIQNLLAAVQDATEKELYDRGKKPGAEITKTVCKEVIESWMAPALSNWVDSTIPEPDESGESESSFTIEEMAAFLQEIVRELQEKHTGKLVETAVTVLENLTPEKAEEILNRVPDPGFYEHMTSQIGGRQDG